MAEDHKKHHPLLEKYHKIGILVFLLFFVLGIPLTVAATKNSPYFNLTRVEIAGNSLQMGIIDPNKINPNPGDVGPQSLNSLNANIKTLNETKQLIEQIDKLSSASNAVDYVSTRKALLEQYSYLGYSNDQAQQLIDTLKLTDYTDRATLQEQTATANETISKQITSTQQNINQIKANAELKNVKSSSTEETRLIAEKENIYKAAQEAGQELGEGDLTRIQQINQRLAEIERQSNLTSPNTTGNPVNGGGTTTGGSGGSGGGTYTNGGGGTAPAPAAPAAPAVPVYNSNPLTNSNVYKAGATPPVPLLGLYGGFGQYNPQGAPLIGLTAYQLANSGYTAPPGTAGQVTTPGSNYGNNYGYATMQYNNGMWQQVGFSYGNINPTDPNLLGGGGNGLLIGQTGTQNGQQVQRTEGGFIFTGNNQGL